MNLSEFDKFLKELEAEAKEAGAEIKAEFVEVSQHVVKGAREAAKAGEELAVDASILREELWEEYEINDRLNGALIIGKFGLLAGPFAKVAIPVAAAYGFHKGPQIVKTHKDWLTKKKDERESNPENKPK